MQLLTCKDHHKSSYMNINQDKMREGATTGCHLFPLLQRQFLKGLGKCMKYN